MDIQTLIQQLGTALPMMGAKDLVSTGSALQFKIGRNPKKVNRVHVRYDMGTDTYDVATLSVRGLTVRQLGFVSMVHADQLHTVLESLTGLCTRL